MATEAKSFQKAKAALFDLDGVLVKTDRLHFAAWKSICDAKGWLFDEKVNDLLRGVPRMESLRIILAHNRISLSPSEENAIAEEKNTAFREALRTLTDADLVPGAIELVKGLRELGVKTAICSSSRNAGATVSALRLEALFDAIITGNDIAKAKPNPEIFLAGARLLDINPANCVVVEDAQAGIDAALAAGMPSVGLGSPENLGGATLLVSSLLGLEPEKVISLAREM